MTIQKMQKKIFLMSQSLLVLLSLMPVMSAWTNAEQHQFEMNIGQLTIHHCITLYAYLCQEM